MPADASLPPDAGAKTRVAHRLAGLLPGVPDKLNWQIYDHCAALTRLYAVYEQFVGELVAEYVRLLPSLYTKYSDLPDSVTTQHRVGIGHILLKMGEKGPYRDLEEHSVVRELAAGLSGASEYRLLADAFFTDRQNLRFETLSRLFASLGFEDAQTFLGRNYAVTEFIRNERVDSSSAEKELRDFVDYRNEAAHRRVENVLSIDRITSIGRFVIALATALAEMVERSVLQRHMDLRHFTSVMSISEVHITFSRSAMRLSTSKRMQPGEPWCVFGTHLGFVSHHPTRYEMNRPSHQPWESTQS
jgi:hypothetical protein